MTFSQSDLSFTFGGTRKTILAIITERVIILKMHTRQKTKSQKKATSVVKSTKKAIVADSLTEEKK